MIALLVHLILLFAVIAIVFLLFRWLARVAQAPQDLIAIGYIAIGYIVIVVVLVYIVLVLVALSYVVQLLLPFFPHLG